MEEGEESERTEQFEVLGVLRLPLAPGTQSGYLGVRPNKSKKRPWQAWIHIKGEKRRCLGCFSKKREAAVARAAAISCGVESLPSPRKQAARKSGAEPRIGPSRIASHTLNECSHLVCRPLTHVVISNQATDRPGPHTSHNAQRERERGLRSCERAAERSSCARRLQRPIFCSSTWRAECPTAAAGSAFAPRCCSHRIGFASWAAAMSWTHSGAFWGMQAAGGARGDDRS